MAAARDRVTDRCPGALVLHEAADGGLARIRLPGGLIAGGTLVALAELAESFGPRGAVELTSRGNLQLRGVPAGRHSELADRVAELGLLPSATHERVRNIVAAPFAGLVGTAGGAGDSALDGLVRALDLGLCADPDLAGLSGRFLFGLDDASGAVAALEADAWAVPLDAGRWWVGPAGVAVDGPDVVGELLAAARGFLRAAVDAAVSAAPAGHPIWRVRDLPDGGAGLAAELRAGRPEVARPEPPPGRRPVGVWRRPDGGHAAAALVPLGRLSRAGAEMLAAAGQGMDPAAVSLRVTPWRSVVVPRLADPASFVPAARRAGLDAEPQSLWALVTACAGRPGCASALADVRADAADAVAAGRLTPAFAARPLPPGARAHWSGCARRCGRPAGSYVDIVAGPDGYLVHAAGAEPKESSRW
ncbi:nitrite reductase [Pseudofrankia inefficax]|uniref:Nitrite/sulfite reductase hemoprotein beta-component ferrodoxin domain protein n=1 Tax=Pseudofrankia inefficax (strain DSM 45817 / CECT 9037 / DDB 130130 / EuI1c) TaxID=298654 RepID=E3JA00_PSEI1|nr:nitrite reductase [Pseudofrankia inefficax]ADP78562.1 nitrite/sulfite reductase hemoprotein beta-component ferrodoxin domain protein [Pseudofrankia inefficax]